MFRKARIISVMGFALLVLLAAGGCADNGDRLQPAAQAIPDAVRFDFDKDEVGSPPGAFMTALTGEGGPGRWEIVKDAAAPSGQRVLAQTSTEEMRYRFPLLVYENFTGRDVTVLVSFKPVSGKIDQAAGIVFRLQDKDNYYVVRANALENNVVLYKVQNGKRVDLKPRGQATAYGVKAEVPKNQWSLLKVEVSGNEFVVSLNGNRLFAVEDNTFTEPGKVGLWTKADSVTHFDDLVVVARNP